jgi:tetratricopeptide (TPR) repeat protein
MKIILSLLLALPIIVIMVSAMNSNPNKQYIDANLLSGAEQLFQPLSQKSQQQVQENKIIQAQAEQFQSEQKYEQAIQLYEKLLQQEPNNNHFNIQKLRILLKLNKQEQAFNLAKELHNNLPDNQEIITLRAHTLIRNTELQQAIIILAQTQSPENSYLRALANIALNNFSNAENELNYLVSVSQNAPWKQNALNLLESIKESSLQPSGPLSYLQTLMAKTLNSIQEHELAIHMATQATEENPDYRDAWMLLGYANLSLQKYKEAEANLMNAYSLDPSKAEIQYFLAVAHNKLNNPHHSNTFLNYALKNNFYPQENIYELLAENAILKEDFEEANAYLNKRLQMSNTTVQDYIRPVWLQIEKRNNLKEARRLSQEAIKSFPNHALSTNLMAWVELASGNTDAAIRQLNQAQIMDPNLAAVYLNLGKAYQAKGDTNTAKSYYEKAINLDPLSTEAEHARQLYNTLF